MRGVRIRGPVGALEVAVAVAAAILLVGAPGRAVGQSPPPPLLTLDTWAGDVWLDLLDREGTYHGRLAPQGIFQRFNPDMDHEYALDVRTGMFQPGEDVEWSTAAAGIRVAGASVSHPHILNRLDWRHAYPVSGRVSLIADYTRDHSLTDRRDYAGVGLRWAPRGAGGWRFASRVGLHFFKPEADVELEAARRWGGGKGRSGTRWDVTVGLAALDAFSDVVFVSLGVDPGEVDAHLDHEGVPLAGRLRLEARGGWWRAELHAGGTTSRRARVTFPGGGADPVTGAPAVELRERVAFAGAVLEGRISPRVAVAGRARAAEARTERRLDQGEPPAWRIRERTAALGAVVRWVVGDAVRLEGEVDAVWRPEERAGVGEPGEGLEHRDRAVYGALGLVRRPASGWTARMAYTTLDRRAGVLLPHVEGRNGRLVTEGGYRSGAGFGVLAGLRWDLDGQPTFDGAHLRVVASGG